MPGPNWWQIEDTAPVESGFADYLREHGERTPTYRPGPNVWSLPEPEPEAPARPGPSVWELPEPDATSFPEALGTELARLPKEYLRARVWGPPIGELRAGTPSYGEMEFATAEDGDFPTMQQYRQEIPKVPKSKSFFESTWDTITDIAGKPLGKMVDALSWTADTTERIIGLAYWNDLPDFSTRWEMGRLSYELRGVPLLGWGSAPETQRRKVRSELLSGKPVDEIVQENEGGWTDIILKLVLDPLNLIGGIPGLTRLPLVGGSKFAATMEKGLLIPALKVGVSPLETLSKKALERATKAGDALLLEGELGQFRREHGLFKMLPTAKAEETKNQLYHIFTGVVGKGASTEELGLVGDALRAGTPQTLRATYGPMMESRNVGLLAQVMAEEGIDIKAFKSLKKPVVENEAAWKALTKKERAGYFQNAEQRTDAFFGELMDEVGPAIDRFFGVPDTKNPLDKIHGALKQALGVAYLNRPGFIVLNVLNNWFTRGATLGFRGPSYTVAELAERGIRPGVFEKVARDTGQFSREYLLHAKGPWWKKTLQLAVNLASKNDQWNRGRAWLKAYERTWNWTWQFDDVPTGGLKGFLPRLPQELRARLPGDFVESLEARILSARNEGDLARLGLDVAAGAPGVSVEKYLLRLARDQGLTPEQTRLFLEMEEPVKLRMNELLREARTPDDVIEGVDRMKAALMQDAYEYRAMDALPPDIPGTAWSRFEGEASFEAHNRRLQQSLWDAKERAMRALGATDDQIQAVKNAHVQADMAIDADRTRTWEAWQSSRRAAGETLPAGATTRLPRNLMRSSPRYNIGRDAYLPRFESDLDRALFVLAQKNKSKADAQFLQFAKGLLPGKTETEIRALGQQVKDAIKGLAQQATPGDLPIPAIFGPVTPTRGAVNIGNPFTGYRTRRIGQKGVRDTAAQAALADNPALAGRLGFVSQIEGTAHNNVDTMWATTWRELRGVTDNATWEQKVRSAHEFAKATYQKMQDDVMKALGIEAPSPAFALPGDYPLMGEMMTGRYSRWAAILDKVKEGAIADMAQAADPRATGLLNEADLNVLRGYVDSLTPQMKTARAGTMEIAKSHTDFVMLNYDNKRGFDEVIKHIYPYEFWPTRTAYNWMRRTWHRPGATAALAKVYDNYADMNRDLPERLKHSVKVPVDMIERFMDSVGLPVPGLPAWAGNDIYFDPIQVMFPIAQWSLDWADEEKQRTLPGRVMDYASRVGPGIAPWISLPLGFSGLLGDREDWIGYQLSGGPFSLPGTRAQRAIASFMANGKDDGTLDDDTKYRVLLGEGLPENRLREMLGLEPGEKWDEYRIHRMLANMTATNEITPQTAMEAMKAGRGKTWNKARLLASQEAGIRALTGWAFGMPVGVYPDGEKIQRGLGQIRELFAKEVERTGDRSLWQQFYGAFPEYQPRQAAVASDDKRQGVLDTNLYWMKFGAVDEKYDAALAEIERDIRQIETGGGLKNKESRGIRAALKDRQSELYAKRDEEIAGLRTEYPKAKATPSLYDAPVERALKVKRNEYYDIKDPDYGKLLAKREAFLGKLPAGEVDGVALQREANAIIFRYRAVIKAAQERRAPRAEITKLYEKRDESLELITNEALRGVTRQMFKTFIDKNKREPTRESREYDEAKRLMGVYQAMPDEDRAGKKAFWAQNPLLEEYYGNDEPKDAVVRENNAMWDSYYALPEGRARRDWMNMNAGRLNELAVALGKEPKYGQPLARPAQTRPVVVPARASFARPQSRSQSDYLERARAAGGR